ncbi:MAG: phosphatidylglycerol lysyltransferase domain-containing protein [Methanocorpusculum sp.]|nr:phosphatidylglycerol lysyltransferase domain-containing protein [Methanocorpusculum sp.]
MTLKASDFKKVTLADKKIFSEYFSKYPQSHSEATFGTIFCWEHYSPCKYALIDNHLIVACAEPGNLSYRPPIGEFSAELFEDFLSFAIANGGDCPVEFPNAQYIDYMKEHHPELPIYPERGYFEYYYRTSNLAELRGKKYLNIRGQINSFKSHYYYNVEKITPYNVEDVKSMIDEWEKSKPLEKTPMMKGDAEAVMRALENMSALGFEGIAIRVGDKICAGALWEELNKEAVDIHFEKGLTDYEGIYKIINQETAKFLLGRYEWINRESDVNEPGLREAKMRYHPSKFAEYYYISRADIL